MKLDAPVATTLAAGAVTAFMVAVMSNLDGAAQLLQGAARSVSGEPFGYFDFWRSSRLMPGQISITEFPFWTFLFADLHAHLISLPFQVTAVGLAVNLALSAQQPLRMLRRGPAVGAMALVVGSLAAINTWDVPAYALLGLAAIGITVCAARRGAVGPTTLGAALLWCAAFWAALYLLFLPFHENYDAPFAGMRFSQWRTVLWHYLGIHGVLFFVAGTWLAVETYRRLVAGPTPVAWPRGRSRGESRKRSHAGGPAAAVAARIARSGPGGPCLHGVGHDPSAPSMDDRSPARAVRPRRVGARPLVGGAAYATGSPAADVAADHGGAGAQRGHQRGLRNRRDRHRPNEHGVQVLPQRLGPLRHPGGRWPVAAVGLRARCASAAWGGSASSAGPGSLS